MTQTQTPYIPPEDLPLWMRKAQRGTDWGIFIVLAFSLLASLPFFLQAGLPQTNDSEHYVYLSHDYATSLREGRLYPRWSAHVLSGYGAPIPNFFPPGAPYSVAIIEILITNDTVNAVRLAYILALCLAGAMTYAFVSRLCGAQVGVMASLLYVYSPYLILTAPHILGDLRGVIALGLLPTVLWSVNRLLLINNNFDFFLTTIISSALVLTDPRYIFVAILLVISLAIYHLIITKVRPIRLGLLIATWAVTACICSFYWIPAILDQQFVHWTDSAQFRHPSYQLIIHDLIAPLRQFDLAELNPRPQLTVGLTSLLLFPVAFLSLLINRKNKGFHFFFLILGFIIAFVGITELPNAVWLLGPINFCFAIGLSVVTHSKYQTQNTASRIYPLFLYVFVLATAFPAWLPPRWTNNFGEITPQDQIDYETNGYGIAVLPHDWELPATINIEDVTSNRFLLNSYDAPNIINHISSDQISARSEANVISSTTHSDRFRVCITQHTEFNFTRAYFPGWQAHISDEVVNIAQEGRSTADFFCPRVTTQRINEARIIQEPQTGLIRISISSPSKGVLTISLGSTDVRRGSWIISWVGLLVLSVSTFNYVRKSNIVTFAEFQLLDIPQVRLTTLIIIGFGTFLLLFTTPTSPFTLYAQPLHTLRNTFALQQRTDIGMELLTYRVNDFSPEHESTLEIELTWRTTRQLRENYQVQVHLENVNQAIRWQESALQVPGNYPTSRWNTSSFVRDTYHIQIPSSLPRGEYLIAVEIFACQPLCTLDRRAIFFDDERQAIGQTLLLPNRVTVIP